MAAGPRWQRFRWRSGPGEPRGRRLITVGGLVNTGPQFGTCLAQDRAANTASKACSGWPVRPLATGVPLITHPARWNRPHLRSGLGQALVLYASRCCERTRPGCSTLPNCARDINPREATRHPQRGCRATPHTSQMSRRLPGSACLSVDESRQPPAASSPRCAPRNRTSLSKLPIGTLGGAGIALVSVAHFRDEWTAVSMPSQT